MPSSRPFQDALRLRRIFDNAELVAGGNGVETIPVDRETGEVDRDDGTCPRGDSGLDGVKVYQAGRRGRYRQKPAADRQNDI